MRDLQCLTLSSVAASHKYATTSFECYVIGAMNFQHEKVDCMAAFLCH